MRARLTIFIHVIMEAAKPAPSSPALGVYLLAKTHAARQEAYALMTEADRALIVADFVRACGANAKSKADELRAWKLALRAKMRLDEQAERAARDQSLADQPAKLRRLEMANRLAVKSIVVTGACLMVELVAAEIMFETAGFVSTLICDWIFWLGVIGANVALFLILMLSAKRKTIISVLRAVPSAFAPAIRHGNP